MLGAGLACAHAVEQTKSTEVGGAAMVKSTIVLIIGGLTGSGIVALTDSLEESQPTGIARQESAAPAGVTTPQPSSPDETNQLEYIQARFAAQRPFGALCAVSR